MALRHTVDMRLGVQVEIILSHTFKKNKYLKKGKIFDIIYLSNIKKEILISVWRSCGWGGTPNSPV